MKKLRLIALALLTLAAIGNVCAGPDLKDILQNVSKSKGSESSSNALGTVGNIIAGLTASSNFELEALQGTWHYESPAVTFKSDNAVQKIGGTAAASTIENKLADYYSKVGVNALTLTIDAENNFTMKLKRGSLKGTVAKDEAGNLVFNFNALGKVKLGKISAYASKSGNTLNLTFDVSKLVSIVKAVSSVAGSSSLSAISSLLSSYDGIYAGFKLRKE